MNNSPRRFIVVTNLTNNRTIIKTCMGNIYTAL